MTGMSPHILRVMSVVAVSTAGSIGGTDLGKSGCCVVVNVIAMPVSAMTRASVARTASTLDVGAIRQFTFAVAVMQPAPPARPGRHEKPRLPEAAADGSATGRGTYRVHFDVPPGSYLMRAVVREPGGLVGSADRKLDGMLGIQFAEIFRTRNGGIPVRFLTGQI